jgi:hypothetical protein
MLESSDTRPSRGNAYKSLSRKRSLSKSYLAFRLDRFNSLAQVNINGTYECTVRRRPEADITCRQFLIADDFDKGSDNKVLSIFGSRG